MDYSKRTTKAPRNCHRGRDRGRTLAIVAAAAAAASTADRALAFSPTVSRAWGRTQHKRCRSNININSNSNSNINSNINSNSNTPGRSNKRQSHGSVWNMVVGTRTELEPELAADRDVAEPIAQRADHLFVTMDDVVATATIELERQQQLREQESLLQMLGDQPQKTHYEWFEEFDQERIAESEKVPLDRLVMDDNQNDNQNDRTSRSGMDDSEIVSWNYLRDLLARGLSHDASAATAGGAGAVDIDIDVDVCPYPRDEISTLCRKLNDAGGYLVVELDDETASIVADLWDTMEAYFALPESDRRVDTQVLEKKDGSHDPNAGYHFQRTFVNADGIVLPETIQEALGGSPESHNGIAGTFGLFADICKTVGTLATAGALDKDLGVVHSVANSLLDDRNGHAFVNAEHRMSQYIVDPPQGDDNNDNDNDDANRQTRNSTTTTTTTTPTATATAAKESLISHTDWTFATCIPLSRIPGLQLWKPQRREWIVPEELLAGSKRSHYVVVMTGKWIELLTNRAVPSCVHRVVTRPSGNVHDDDDDDNDNDSSNNDSNNDSNSNGRARLSAPFFCRTKRYVFDMVKDRFDERPTDLSREAAMDEMGGLFADLVRFTEGSRDPEIPGCVLDVCLDGEDSFPGCFRMEDVLAREE